MGYGKKACEGGCNSSVLVYYCSSARPRPLKTQLNCRKSYVWDSRALPKEKNTTIPFWIIEQFRSEWQGHLKRVSDYLLECWWAENEEGIQFFDNEKNPKSKIMVHHFRTCNLESEMIHLQICWENCLKAPTCIPAKDVVGLNGKIQRVNNITFLIDTLDENTTPSLVHTQIQKHVIPEESENMEGVDFNVEKINHILPRIIPNQITNNESLALTKTNKMKRKLIDDEVVLIKPIQTLPSSDVLKPSFQTKTASYIYIYIYIYMPFAKELVCIYDKARIKANTFPNDEISINDFSLASAQIEVKIVGRNEELKQTQQQLEMKEILERNVIKPYPTNDESQKQYDDIIYHLKIIRALRSELKF